MAQAYDRVFNFSAGPATLPVAVLEQARDEMLNWHGTGMSVMEMSHRSKAYQSIIDQAEADFRTLLEIPTDYKVLFLQGGASLQFTMLPMNLRPEGASADYVITGSWGKKAIEAGKIGGQARAAFDAKASNYDHAPHEGEVDLDPNCAYVHVTLNETIQGVDFRKDPSFDRPLACDMSSNICSRPIDVSKYDVIYAGAQKNLGPAGLTVVIVKDSVLEQVPQGLPPMLDYRLQSENGSMYNTPPTYAIYIAGLCFKHQLDQGGLQAVAKHNEAKAKLIYDAIDGSNGFYKGHAKKENRSLMNISFTLANDDLTKDFLEKAKAEGMNELKGHRSVGGCRASVYNAFPIEGCKALAEFMAEFARTNG